MTIAVGDRIPAATFKTPTADGPQDITTGSIFTGRTVVLFAVPGAFTPTCHNNHLPAFWPMRPISRRRASTPSRSPASMMCMS